MAGGDSGNPIVDAEPESSAARELGRIAERIRDSLGAPVRA